MHGLGNDFIIINGLNPQQYNINDLAADLCHRNTGIGGDGLVLVLPSDVADVQMRIYNSDGSEPEMCGNAIRCFAKYVYEKEIITQKAFSVETLAGIIKPELIIEHGEITGVRVDMGKPGLNRSEIPMVGAEGTVIDEEIEVNGETLKISSMLMGVPHTMVYINDFDSVDLKETGSAIEKHPSFPEGTNVNFVQVLNNKEIKVRTWERGAGETLACGTGSCAASVASSLNNFTGKAVDVHLYLGMLKIEWENDTVFMTGPAETAFVGTVNIDEYKSVK